MKSGPARKPPAPTDKHADIDDWIARQMPDLQPIVKQLDELICRTIAGLHYAIKWKKVYYGLPSRGWIIELVAYDVSVNLVFLGGANFAAPPPDGTGASRYIKLRSVDELQTADIGKWIKEASRVDGWK